MKRFSEIIMAAGKQEQEQEQEPGVPSLLVSRSPPSPSFDAYSATPPSPSFDAYSANRLHQIAARVILEITAQDLQQQPPPDDDDTSSHLSPSSTQGVELKNVTDQAVDGCCNSDSDDDDDFEFTFVCRDPDTSEITADELFSDGQIRPSFPVFNRDLVFSSANDDARASSSADTTASIMLPLRKLIIDDSRSTSRPPQPPTNPGGQHEDVSEEGTYCVWTPRSPVVPPSPGQCKKSRSTGSSSRRWKLRDLLHRSSSDGKDTFVFLSAGSAAKAQERGRQAENPNPNAKGTNGNSSSSSGAQKKKKATGLASAHEIHYVRNRATKEGDRRRSYLPYRQGIVGFFSNP